MTEGRPQPHRGYTCQSEAREIVKNFYNATDTAQLKQRIASLTPGSQRLWGKMSVAQMLAHCSNTMEMATDDVRPPRMFIGRILGSLIKKKALGDGPMGRNAPTAKILVIPDERDLEKERTRLAQLIDRFCAAGPSGCTKHPHTFFGPMSPDEWSLLMYKHIDHHLQQFGA